ncbi:MAG: hypothetical protein ACI8W7_003339, partial [Gammaproteobacteria bacterium]
MHCHAHTLLDVLSTVDLHFGAGDVTGLWR